MAPADAVLEIAFGKKKTPQLRDQGFRRDLYLQVAHDNVLWGVCVLIKHRLGTALSSPSY